MLMSSLLFIFRYKLKIRLVNELTINVVIGSYKE